MGTIAGVKQVPIGALTPYERNAKLHSPEQVRKIADSIREFGFISPCLIDREGNVIAGHGRLLAAQELGMTEVPCVYVEGLTEAQRRAYVLADNRLTELGEWDMEIVTEELAQLEDMGFDVSLVGFERENETGEAAAAERAITSLRDRFVVSPFSIFDTRTAWWMDRKRAWKAIGLRSELGRGADGDATQDGLTYAKSHQPPALYRLKNEFEDAVGHTVTWDEFFEACPNAKPMSNTSIFDPVITEVAVRWYSKAGDRIIDPFAGGSVRGAVSALLGRHYTGVDLSERQIKANRENWAEIKKDPVAGEEVVEPTWICGDSMNIKGLAPGAYDLLLTCPPYADLEVYSDDVRDISNMNYEDFRKAYCAIIKNAVSLLKDNAFAVVVVGDVRDRKGNYRNFVGLTIDAFEQAGMTYYNEGILITSTGAVSTVVARQFSSTRKIGKVHQNVLIFHDEGGIHSVNVDDADEMEKAFTERIKDQNGKLVVAHEKVLTFAKGNAKQRTTELGDVESETNDEFFVSLE